MMQHSFLSTFFFNKKTLFIASLLVLPALAQDSEPPELATGREQRPSVNSVVERASINGDRKNAYALLMAGQRNLWLANRTRDRIRATGYLRNAQDALIAATETDPTIAEAFTLLAEVELSLSTRTSAIDKAIEWLDKAILADAKNFGGRRLRARLLSSKAGFRREGGGQFDEAIAKKALADWEAVSASDPRNAEAWAFIGTLYERFGDDEKAINAFRAWKSSSTPLDRGFYSFVMGQQDELTVQNASLKLSAALLRTGSIEEAILSLSSVISEEPNNQVALAMLRDTLSHYNDKAALIASDVLYQSVNSNFGNTALLEVLGDFYGRKGKIEKAKELYRRSIELADGETMQRSQALGSYGEFLFRNRLYSEAADVFRDAINTLGLTQREAETESEREFAITTFASLIRAERLDGNLQGARRAIEDSNKALGDDVFADRQLINLLRGSGRQKEALDLVKGLRKRLPDDIGLIRLEATLLSDTGSVETAVENFFLNIRGISSGVSAGRDLHPSFDDFSNQVFVSELYARAKRGNEAIDAANRAFVAAKSKESRQIARLTLATAQNVAGDFESAEATLRKILDESPSNPFALNNLGYFLLERNERIADAKAMIERALSIDPTNPSFLDSLGWAYFKLGEYAEAERRLSQAAIFDPESATIQEHLGDVFHKLGERERAKGAWEAALNLATDREMIRRLKDKLAKGR